MEDQRKAEKRETQRRHVEKEIRDTEIAYVKDLETILTVTANHIIIVTILDKRKPPEVHPNPGRLSADLSGMHLVQHHEATHKTLEC